MTNWEDKTPIEDRTLKFFITGLKNLWALIGSEKKRMLIVLVWIILLTILSLLGPLFIKLIFDELPQTISSHSISTYLIIILIAFFVVGMAERFLVNFVKEIIFIKSLVKLENLWPVMAQKKLLELSIGYHEKENIGKKIAKINKGCDKLVDLVGNLMWNFIPQLLYLAINGIIILVIDWRLGLIFLIPYLPAAYINLQAYKKFGKDWENWEIKKEQSNGLFCQSLFNVQTVQSYVQEEKEKSNLGKVRMDMDNLDVWINCRMQQRYFFPMGTILHVGFFLSVLCGVYFIYQGYSTLGTVIYLITTSTATNNNLWQLINVYTKMMRNLVAVNRMKELLDEPVDIYSKPQAIIPATFHGLFEFDRVTFIYPNKEQPVLSKLNLEIHPGQMIALVGKSGEGKTTAIRLLARMYDVNTGKIKLDGQDIRDLDLNWYRRLFAIVQQDVEIFDNTLLYNVTYSNSKATPEQVRQSIEAAHLQVTVENKERFPKGLYTQVGEKGIRLSGGERQRVGIARAYLALLTGAKVLILDEATSNLDSEAEKAIQKMLDEIRTQKSVSIVAIAHRLSTISRSDMIYVISGGQVEEAGDHTRLLQQNGLYSKLVGLQQLGELRE